MATQTLKTGTPVTVKDNLQKGTITSIEKGKYRIDQSKILYSARDLVADKTTPEQKPRKPINKTNPKTATLKLIYQNLSRRWLQHNKLCRARFAGCTHHATQVHHMYKRSGFWLIMTKFFFPICTNCHRRTTNHSAEAIKAGVSVSRHQDVEYDFNEIEKKLMKQHNLTLPA